MRKILPFLMAGFFVAILFNTTSIYAATSIINTNKNTGFMVGQGTIEEPYQISTIEELDAIRNYPDNNFLLIKNLDFRDDDSYANPTHKIDYITGDGWLPIGSNREGPAFTGSFDGQGFTIYNLFVNRSSSVYSSLFGYLFEAQISHLHLDNVQVTGRGAVGSFAGGLTKSIISDCYATGQVKGSGYYIGGLVGWNNGTISSCHVSVEIIGYSYVGGLVGYNEGLISDSSVTGNVIGNDFDKEIRNIGGLIGGNGGDIIDSFATGDVTGNTYVGGLVGANWQNISYCYATGKVTHVWHNYGNVTFGRRFVGRLSGADFGTTLNSYATGKISIKLFVEGLFWHILYQLLPDQGI